VSGADERSPRALWVKAALLVVVLGTGLVTWLVARTSDVASLQAATRGWGRWAPVLFVAGYALITLTPVPKGCYRRLLASLSVCPWGCPGRSCRPAGGCARFYSRPLVGPRRGRTADRHPPGAGRPTPRAPRVAAVLAVRLVPLVPFTAINYAAGLSTVRRRDYAWGTSVGIIPGTLSYVALGSGTASRHRELVLVAASVLVLLNALAARAMLRRRQRRPEIAARVCPQTGPVAGPPERHPDGS